jgi:hypothetical protein
VAAVLLALWLAGLSYRYIESPLRHHVRLARPSRALGLAAVVTLAVVGAGMVWRDLARSWSRAPDQQQYASARRDLADIYRSGCHYGFYAERVDPAACTRGAAGVRPTVVLLGDSHAAQWYPAFQALATAQRWRLVPMTKYDCPAVDQPKHSRHLGRRYVECEAWRDSALQAIETLRPDLTVLASSSEQPFTAAQWRVGTDRVVRRAAGASRAVVLLGDTPHPGFDVPTCLGRRAWASGLVPRPSCDMADALDGGASAREALRETATRYRNAHTLDLDDLLCPEGVCQPAPGGSVAYRDADHLRATYARDLAPALGRRLAGVLSPNGTVGHPGPPPVSGMGTHAPAVP